MPSLTDSILRVVVVAINFWRPCKLKVKTLRPLIAQVNQLQTYKEQFGPNMSLTWLPQNPWPSTVWLFGLVYRYVQKRLYATTTSTT